MNTKTMRPVSLLEINDEYIQTAWMFEHSQMQVIAIYRATDRRFALSQLRGPWSVVDKETGDVVNITDGDEYPQAATTAIDILHELNSYGIDSVKQEWVDGGGLVYDF